MTEMVELGFQPTTVFALRHYTIHAFIYTLLILECLYKCPSIYTCPSGTSAGDASSLKPSLISCPQKPRGYDISDGYKEWLLAWGNNSGD